MSSHIHSRPTLFSIILLKKEKKSACAQLFSLLQFIRKFTIWPVFPPGFHHFLAAFSSSLLLFFLTGILKRLKLRREALLSEGSGVLLSFFCSTLNYFWWEMEIISPATHFSGRNWLINESESHAKWTPAENKTFENALAVYDKDTPDRWQKVAVMIPGKTVADVMRQYKELEVDVSNIEAGLIPIPGYGSSSFKLDCVDSHGYDAFNHSYVTGGKRSLSGRAADQERKKGIPWTEEEHKRFLMGLKKYGKGDWRNISRNFVITRTPTQVASHAQKYFIRQLSGGKDKRRASIHDITTVNLNDVRTPSPDNKKPSSPCQSAPQQPDSAAMSRTSFQWSQSNGGVTAGLYSMQGNTLMFSPHGMSSYGNKMQGQNLPRDAIHESYIGPQSIAFQMQSSQNYPHGCRFNAYCVPLPIYLNHKDLGS